MNKIGEKNKGISIDMPSNGEYRGMEWYVEHKPEIYNSGNLNPDIVRDAIQIEERLIREGKVREPRINKPKE